MVRILFTAIRYCLFLCVVLNVWSCSDAPNGPTTDTEMEFVAELSESSVQGAFTSAKETSPAIQALTAIQIQKVRILVKELKLRPLNNSSSEKPVKTSPFVIQYDAGKTTVFATSTVANASYDQVKFEFHRFSASEISTYQNDGVFKDFVVPDRATIIIEGTLTDNGTIPFTYRSDVTANLALPFSSAITVDGTGKITVLVQFSVSSVFKKGSTLLDPRDTKNRNDIDNALKSAIKALKK